MKFVVGIDLSGPGSPENTAVAVFRAKGKALQLQKLVCGASDTEILNLVPEDAVVGLDAPLSYSMSGGSRESDVALRKLTIEHGLHPGTVMAPSAPRMVYLTLRGVALTRLLEQERKRARLVEVHPRGPASAAPQT